MNIEKTLKSIKERSIEAVYFKSGDEAVEYLKNEIKGKTVGFGGSMTAKELGLFEALENENTVLSHWVGSSSDIREDATRADVYISSANAIAETGEIVNIDGYGNRVVGTLSEKEAVYIIAGTNKICPDLESAIWRARNVASPKNAQRLGKNTPCAKNADKCYDCRSPERICNGMVISMGKMRAIGRMVVVIIDGTYGL
jgi:L-lactate utilization protein LutB